MKRKKKRLLSGFLAMLMIICFIPTRVYGEEDSSINNQSSYIFDATTLTSIGEDKAKIPEGTTYADGFF